MKSSTPNLPEQFNELLSSIDIPIPKWQQITRDDKPITIARLKLPHPREKHTFILRRYDCNGISFGSLFKAAYPYASDDEEKSEANYVKSNYDCKLVPTDEYKDLKLAKLAGFWIPLNAAKDLGKRYNMEHFVNSLIEANTPDLSDFKKRSSNKEREMSVSSPAKAQASLESPVKPSKIPTPSKSDKNNLPPPRRSARHQSRSPSPSPLSHNITPGKKKARKSTAPQAEIIEESVEEIHVEKPTPSSSPLKNALNDDQIVADIEHAKDLVDDIKQSKQLSQNSQKNESPKKTQSNENDDNIDKVDSLPSSSSISASESEDKGKRKREVEDETGNEVKVVSFGQSPPTNVINNQEIQQRPIVQRRGVAAAVGAFALGVGFAASNILPRFLF